MCSGITCRQWIIYSISYNPCGISLPLVINKTSDGNELKYKSARVKTVRPGIWLRACSRARKSCVRAKKHAYNWRAAAYSIRGGYYRQLIEYLRFFQGCIFMPYSGVRKVIVSEGDVGQRLDNYLMRQFKGVPKSRIYSMLRKGEVRVNKGRVKPAYRIQTGDMVRFPPVHIKAQAVITVPDAVKHQLTSAVVFEDENLILINKPSGIAVHSGSGLSFGVIETMRELRPHAGFLELVHRLDRETSGCLLLARSRRVLTELHGLLREGEVNKRYLALLAGHWEKDTKTITSQLERGGPQGQIRRTRQQQNGKIAISEFRPVKHFSAATLMEVKIFTGRTHQIRVQSADAGHPVLGDDKYGNFALNREFRKLGLKRLFLHAAEIDFRLESCGHRYHFKAELPDVLETFLQKLDEK